MGEDAPRRHDEPTKRLGAVDALRGLAIVLMALDHVREYLQAEQFNPLDLQQTNAPLYFTRWITHFCAPLFILLAGAGMALGLSPERSRWQQARFLLVRGIWLVILELTVVHWGWFFNVQFQHALGAVIWVIGWAMISMSALIFLPPGWVAAIGLTMIAGHNLLDSVHPAQFGKQSWFWMFLHEGGYIPGQGWSLYIAYPLIPWLGVMATGFGFGQLLRWSSPLRPRVISAIGIAAIVLFAVLRGSNLYGDPTPWTPQRTPLRTFLDVLDCEKYPPSLCYLLMTLGPPLALWPWLERRQGPMTRFLITFGRVPLFIYLLHLPVIHALAIAVTYLQQGTVPAWLWDFPPGHAGPGGGVSLPILYLLWIAVVLLLWPVCRWYGFVKSRTKNGLLRFL